MHMECIGYYENISAYAGTSAFKPEAPNDQL